jgi:pimeloyl-ACP methyl ester carboxylesterase
MESLPQSPPRPDTSALPWRHGMVAVDGVDIFYEELGAGDPIVLIMGLSIQSIFWPDAFCQALVDAGHRVIRFDNRDIGLSAAVDRGVAVNITKDFLLSRAGLRVRANYTLHEMVADTVGLLDHLKIDRAHVVGISLGGIIAQMMWASHPSRVRSLAFIMSHTNHPIWGTPHPAVLLRMGPPPRGATREQIIARNVETFQLLGSPGYRRTDEELRHAFSVAYDRDSRAGGSERQTHALFATRCTDTILPTITVPTTIMHGTADRLVLPRNSQRMAKMIRHARLTMFPGMGHDFPPALLPTWAAHIVENARSA